jgi:prevent-host-death family protein
MKTATVREFRHAFPKVLRWIEDGETVTLTKRGKPVAQVTPPPAAKPRKVVWPDIAARARAYSEGVRLTAKQAARIIRESRGEL